MRRGRDRGFEEGQGQEGEEGQGQEGEEGAGEGREGESLGRVRLEQAEG